MKLYEKIYHYRRQAKMSQEQLAAAVGVSRQAVSKWELGEATPEVDKLLTLAKTFGVTVDELLSEEEPKGAEEKVGIEADMNPQQEAAAQSSAGGQNGSVAQSELEKLPGFLKRIVWKYGWLAGIYVALSGLGLTIVGAIARFMFGTMFSVSSNVFGSMGVGGVTIEGLDGLLPEAIDQIVDGIGGGMGSFGSVNVVDKMGSAFMSISSVIMAVGVVIIVAGVCLALWLRRKGKEAQENHQ